MLLYSNTIHTFLARTRKYCRVIMLEEMKIGVRRHRFEYNGLLYPFNLVVFEKSGLHGYFDPHGYQIGLHKNLMLSAKTPLIKNIIRHELAHYMSYLENGDVKSHGREFKEICERYGWGRDVSEASMDLASSNDKIEGDLPSEKIISKIKKLMNLSSSLNEHEAKLATIKANQLLLRHNLESLPDVNEEEVCVLRVLEGKRNSAKYHAIYEILTTFFVQPVFNYGKEGFYLEVTGPRVNVELAQYVANFLDHELEHLWKNVKKEKQLKGHTAKNSFMKGLSEGYVGKIKETQAESTTGKELITLKNSVKRYVELSYGRLSHSATSRGKSCETSKSHGRSAGKNLSIRPGIKNKSTKKYLPFLRG